MADRAPSAARPPLLREADIIARYLAPLAASSAGAFGLQDDCATLSVPVGCELVVTTDAVVSGVHLLGGTSASDFGWKALAVNVSDLIAKGARPIAYSMQLTLADGSDMEWLQGVTNGLADAQNLFGCSLIGGDTDVVPGAPNAISITAYGTIPAGRFVRRQGALVGDVLVVTGVIGCATLGLRLLRDDTLTRRAGVSALHRQSLTTAQVRPKPLIAIADVVRDHAVASLDVSDGLIKDAARLCAASGAGAVVRLGDVPVSQAARAVVAANVGVGLIDLATGGEDYVVLAAVRRDTVAAFVRAALAVGATPAIIGEVVAAENGFEVLDVTGTAIDVGRLGWDHFDQAPASPDPAAAP